MALPKQRHSKARGRRRRTHWKLSKMSFSKCPQCKTPKLTHRVCKVCGFYQGRQVVEVKVKESKKKPR
ncbi:MAG: 50S ribosomal protein L32 [Candidatus Omnitrophica bacterium]|nr:50S ribosomal protein L32 [Candidatus Omnitrophota bacterium]